MEGQQSHEISIPFTCKGVGRCSVSVATVGLMGMGEWEDAGQLERDI